MTDGHAAAKPCYESISGSIMGGQAWGEDMILGGVLSFDDLRVHRRAVAPHWRLLVESRFPPHHKYEPPCGGVGFVELEEDLQMNKFIYSATLRFGSGVSSAPSSSVSSSNRQPHPQQLKSEPKESAREGEACCEQLAGDLREKNAAGLLGRSEASQGGKSTVAFMNWVPSYYRSNVNDDREVVHEMEETDAIATWILVTKLLRQCKQHSDNGVSTTAEERSSGQPLGPACIACSGTGCRLCNGTGVRVGAEVGAVAGGRNGNAGRGFLWVRTGTAASACAINGNSEGDRQLGSLAMKHPLSAHEVVQLQTLLDHRRNPCLRRQERVLTPFVPFGGVSNV